MPGRPGIDAHVVAPVRAGEVDRQAELRAFDAQSAGCDVPESRMDAIEPMFTMEPPPRSINAGIANSGREERAGEVDADDLLVELERGLGDRDVARDRRIVHKDVEPAE